MSWWSSYKRHIRDFILDDTLQDQGKVSYWRTTVFCEILTYLTPLSLIAVIPSVFMAFEGSFLVVGITHLFAFFTIVLITVVPDIKLKIRKGIFIFVLYCLSVILLFFLPLPGPGILFLLVVTIFSSLIYSSSAAYKSAMINTIICITFAVVIHLGVQTPIFSFYTLGAWIAVSSNLVLLSFACAKCLDLLLAGLTKSLKDNKISEAKLEKANRLYQFVSQINQTIVHAKDAETLFRKSCDIALKYGNYHMAWIGGFDMAKKKISLLDSCGIPLENMQQFTDIHLEKNGPQEYVLRTGTYFLCNDAKNAHAILNKTLFVEKDDIGSFIVLPIKRSEQIFGTFNLYASEPNYFNTDDIALLEEVVGDISFALNLFEKAERHKEAQLQLQKNFEKLEEVSNENSAILNALPASIALLDNEGNILKINEEWRQFGLLNGIQDDYEYLGKNYIEACNKAFGKEAEDGKRMAQGLRDIFNGSKVFFQMEYVCDTPTEKRWFNAEVRPFKNNHLNGAVVMHMDITERKKAEAEMLLLINNTEEAFIMMDRDLKIVSFNNQFKNLYAIYFGKDIQKGANILDFAQPERRELLTSIYGNVLKGSVVASKIMSPPINGTTNHFSIKYSPAKDDSGTIFGAFVTAVDITEKQKAKEQKEFERQNKEALINSTDDLIWSISTDFKLMAANDAFIREMKDFTGVDIKQGEDFMGFDNILEESLNHWAELYDRAFLGESFKVEIHNPASPDREESWIDTSFNPIIVNEQIVGIACYSRNITERKKAENQLIMASTAWQQSVEDLNKVMDSSLDVICAVDANGTILKVSAASKAVWGYAPEELIGTPIFNLVHQDDIKKTKRSARDVMNGNNINHFENRYVRKDGTLVTLEWNARWDAKDQIRYGVARDVSEKKRLEHAIKNERQRFYDLFSDAPTSMGVLSGPNHIFEIVNPLLLELIGKKDIIGRSVKEVLPEVVHQGFIELLDDVYHTGNTFSGSEVLIKLDVHNNGQLEDKYLNLMYRAHRTKTDIIDGILFFAVDVTEQVILRKKIEVSEEKLKKAQALLHISNWEIDLAAQKSIWSDECYKLLGLRREDAPPSLNGFLSMIHPEDYKSAKAKVEATFTTFESGSFSARIITGDGRLIYGYCEWKFEFDGDANPSRLYGILQDITERKLAEEERIKITNDLLQRNRDLEQFTFIISHNLRAPAANIMGFTEYLQDTTITPQEQKDLLQGLSSSVSGLDTIIKDINSILQVKREITEKKETIFFSKTVDNIIDSIGNTIEKNQVQIHTDFHEVDEIFSLKVYLHSIFYNLISNSIKYRRPEDHPRIEIKSKKENGNIILTFKDNGLGLDLDKKGDKIFRLYQRFHNHVEGKGMGLFMVKTQVEAIGGKISVNSEPLKGTEFTIVFEN